MHVLNQPLAHKFARGTVLDYRVHVVSRSLSTKHIFPATDSALVNISNLADDVEYFLTIDARTQAGYNDSLHLETIYIPKSANGLFLQSKMT